MRKYLQTIIWIAVCFSFFSLTYSQVSYAQNVPSWGCTTASGFLGGNGAAFSTVYNQQGEERYPSSVVITVRLRRTGGTNGTRPPSDFKIHWWRGNWGDAAGTFINISQWSAPTTINANTEEFVANVNLDLNSYFEGKKIQAGANPVTSYSFNLVRGDNSSDTVGGNQDKCQFQTTLQRANLDTAPEGPLTPVQSGEGMAASVQCASSAYILCRRGNINNNPAFDTFTNTHFCNITNTSDINAYCKDALINTQSMEVCLRCPANGNVPVVTISPKKYGEECDPADTGKVCNNGQGLCRKSALSSKILCLAQIKSLDSGVSCTISEDECKSFSSGNIPLSCHSSGNIFGETRCNALKCDQQQDVVISTNSTCTSAIGEQGYCVTKKDDSNSYCANLNTVKTIAANPNAYNVDPVKLKYSVDALGLGVNIGVDIPTHEANVSPAAGACNCPGLRSLCVVGGKADPALLQGLTLNQLNDRIRAADLGFSDPDAAAVARSCFTCVSAGNTWTDTFGCVNTTVSGLFTSILRVALGVIGGIVLIRLIMLGYQYAFSSEKMKLQEAVKNVLAILGSLLLVLFSVIILRIIGVNILDVVPPGFF